jgi:hypothetical protein
MARSLKRVTGNTRVAVNAIATLLLELGYLPL